MSLPNPRITFFLMFLAVVFLLSAAFYLEYVRGLEPCPLCITQRVMLLGVGLVSLIACLHNPATIGRRFYGLLVSLWAMGGLYFSGRQIWLQNLPEDQVPACGPGISYMLDAFPVSDVIRTLLTGDGNCAEVQWTLMGLSIPGWAAVGFAGLILFGGWQAFRKH
ncbi:disulfide bond formation protein B [Microbulbifer thermotolerans]|uniref:Disulfide bond formation protein B n=1 Tax=Microbulbifer thermotolerans TaxID=252514 RepID=A0A143HRE2_MICTH|nr:disulfide bond formation protein B [Microbulbifer thermotolerans]AMX03842.1 disulfide bond formation protein DsbB [Microbulbifer thermotolerans]MCX2778660.1 disulfide bond formation protein B [Microbulbifer thermotolerans]MCX2783790.1 disulfide bond formation protein B [Microbulbifer thermotolerans]MCX2794130.1 disulfide bond formation protein B [Microbulbifer thermotolerans]MCX2801621.1 disulfide bond formation protein B [Microbulbifer thermotolerans]